MKANEKAIQLVKITFVKFADESTYKNKGQNENFIHLEDLSKKIAIEFVNEMIKSHIEWETEQGECVDYWESVRDEIAKI